LEVFVLRRKVQFVHTPGQMLRSIQFVLEVKHTISRLTDGYADGLIDKDEFTLRIRRAKERSARLDEQLRSQVELTAQRRELLLLITRLEDFTTRIKNGLQHADWHTKRDLVPGSCAARRNWP
jgi:site-specific DNA recombinase